MNFQARCETCKKTVTAIVLVKPENLHSTLDNPTAAITVMHTADDGDHIWNLRQGEKETLRKRVAEGLR